MAASSRGVEFLPEEIASPQRPRFGRCWWFWFPSVRWNRGNPFKQQNFDLNFHWFCFAWWITIYGNIPKQNMLDWVNGDLPKD